MMGQNLPDSDIVSILRLLDLFQKKIWIKKDMAGTKAYLNNWPS